MTTVQEAIERFYSVVKGSKSVNTARAYAGALDRFTLCMIDNDADPIHSPIDGFREDWVGKFAEYLTAAAPTTQKLYMSVLVQFYKFLFAEELQKVNLPRVEMLSRSRTRKVGARLPQFPQNDIDKMCDYVLGDDYTRRIAEHKSEEYNEMRELLALYRDRAFILTLADTGLRVHEACGLLRGDLDINEGRAVLIGKGDKQAIVRFSARSLGALKSYLNKRQVLLSWNGRISAQPVFSRHDRGAGKNILPLSTGGGRHIINEVVRVAVGPDEVGTITPHSFRHYFVTRVLQSSGNLKLAQSLARHASISMTERYAHLANNELDKGYHEAIET
jgi:integrase/recombinase XerC